MRRTLALLFVLVLVASSIAMFLPVNAESRTIVVPDDFPTISLAIENASTGDIVFVKKGTYQESTLEINKSLQLIGEDVDETTLNLDPPLFETRIMRSNKIWVPVTAITINADNVKLQGFTINMPRGDYGYGSGLHANGDRIGVIDNKIANSSLYLSGTSISVTDNLIASTLEVAGSNQTIANNSIQEYLKIQGSFNKITDNRINSHFYLNGSFNFISGNSFATMSMEGSMSNFVSANFLERLVLGDFGHSCSDNLITKNKVNGNGRFGDGIWVESGSNNTVSANTIRDCEYGLTLGSTASVVTKNSFYLNNFINNSNNVHCYGESNWTVNHFDNGAKGNYYDDYKGSDKNGDGIGDSPYTIEETRWEEDLKREVTIVYFQDNYPLMAPFDIDSVSIELPEWASASSNPSPEPQTSEPFPAVLVIAFLGTSVSVASIGLLIFFKKRKREVGLS